MANKSFGQKQINYTNTEIAELLELLEWVEGYMQHTDMCATQHGKMRDCDCEYGDAWLEIQHLIDHFEERATDEI